MAPLMFLMRAYAMMRNPTIASQNVGSIMRCLVHIIALDTVPPAISSRNELITLGSQSVSQSARQSGSQSVSLGSRHSTCGIMHDILLLINYASQSGYRNQADIACTPYMRYCVPLLSLRNMHNLILFKSGIL
jgi:hypothetical protein